MGLGGVLGLGEVRDLYRKVGDIGGLHFHQVPSKSVPRGAKTSQKTVYLRIPLEQTTCRFLQARTEPRLLLKGLTGTGDGSKIASFQPVFSLDSPSGGQEDCGKGPSWVGEGRAVPLSTAPCPKRVKRRVRISGHKSP